MIIDGWILFFALNFKLLIIFTHDQLMLLEAMRAAIDFGDDGPGTGLAACERPGPFYII